MVGSLIVSVKYSCVLGMRGLPSLEDTGQRSLRRSFR